MNSKLSKKIIVQGFRYKFCRFLSIQSNKSESLNTRHTINLHYKNEINSSNYVLTKILSQRIVCHSPRSLCINFHRNISSDTIISTKSISVAKNALDNEIPPLVVDSPTIFGPEPISVGNMIDIWSQNILAKFVENSIIDLHQFSGLPWWASFALSAFILRTFIVLPFSIFQMRLIATEEKVDIILRKILKNLNKDSKVARKHYGWPDDIINHEYYIALKKEKSDLIGKYNCHPLKKYYLVSIQVSLWITCTLASVHMCLPPPNGIAIYSELINGGFSWITNLTLCDPYCILPIAIGLTNLAIVEIHDAFRINKISPKERLKYNFFRYSSLLIPAAALSMPVATNIYWLSSSLYGLLQALILHTKSARQLLKVPIIDPRITYPYLLNQRKSKLQIASK